MFGALGKWLNLSRKHSRNFGDVIFLFLSDSRAMTSDDRYMLDSQSRAGLPRLAVILIDLVDLTLPLCALSRRLPRHHIFHPILHGRVRDVIWLEQSYDKCGQFLITFQRSPSECIQSMVPPGPLQTTSCSSQARSQITKETRKIGVSLTSLQICHLRT